ncbi:MAG: flagellar hook-basal body complex protein [Pseudomonadota bacterium]
MDNAAYLSLSRLSGLRKEMTTIANNLANMSTTGFRREGIVFSEFIRAAPSGGASLSMTEARVRRTDMTAGAMERTGGDLDLAIDGAAFFMVADDDGPRLTRAGAFQQDQTGVVVDADGRALLDEGGAEIAIPPDVRQISIEPDGAVLGDGRLLARVGLVTVESPEALRRQDGVRFLAEGPLLPGEATVAQGFVEGANVSPVEEMARMIDVQRAYEMGQSLLSREDERIRAVVRTMGGSG